MKDKLLQTLKSVSKGKSQNTPKKKKEKDFLTQCKGKLCYAFDFGEYATKIAVARVTKDKVEVKNMIVIENGENTPALDEESLKKWNAKIARTFLKYKLGPAGQIALCTIGCRNYISREIEIPYAEEEDREGLVAHEMSQSLSMDMDAYLFQHKLLRIYEENGIKMCTVWAAAVPKRLCENYYKLLDSLKLKPLIMDINIHGMERLFEADRTLHTQVQSQTVAVLDYGMRGTEISIYEKGRYQQGTNIELGDGYLVSMAKNVLGAKIADIHNPNKLVVSPRVVYDILRQADQSDAAKSFMTVIEEWLTEVNAVIKRYNLNHPSEPVERILLAGGSLQFAWLKAYLDKYLAVPTEVISNTQCFTIQANVEDPGNVIPQFINVLNLFLIH